MLPNENQPSAPPPVAPPPVPTVVSAAEEREPWGFWATLGWGAVIAFAGLMVQGAVLFGYIALASAHAGRLVTPDPEALAANGLLLSLATLLSAPVVVFFCVLLAWLRRGYPVREYLGLRLPTRRVVVVWGIGLLVFVIASDGLTMLLDRPIVPEFMVNAMKTAVIQPLLWLAVVVAAPVSEEMFFRGFLLQGLRRRRFGSAGAVVLTSLLWTVIHQQYDLYQLAWIFVAGVFLGIARVTTGSVVLCILLHGLMNLIATVQAAIYVASR